MARGKLQGDVDGDGMVDIVDLVLVARVFGSKPGDQTFVASNFGWSTS